MAKASRQTKSVIPVMMAIGLLFGIVAVGQTTQSTLYAMGEDVQLSGVGPGAMLTFLGLPLLIALSGGVGSLIMMSKQRAAELALSGIAGATPVQRLAMPIFEGLIIAVTGAILSLFMVAAAVVFLAIALPAAGSPFAFSPTYATFGLAFAVCAAITVAATLLPTLTSLRVPEPRVIARLVAE